MAELNARAAKLVQYLNEAHGKEKELETALQAHIAMTTRPPYSKRLQQHLTETKQHARALERRVKQLGGTAHAVPFDVPEPVAKGAQVAVEVGSRALAAAQGPLHALRGTGEQEKMLKNAKAEYREEHEEIATYTAIETLAQLVGDSDTAALAREIRRDEQSMARFLERQIPALTKAVVQAEIPVAQRRGVSTGRRRSSRGSSSSANARKPASAKRASAKSASGKRASAKSAAAKRASSKPASAKRASAKRASAKPASAKRAAAKASGAKAAGGKATTGKTATRKAGAGKASTGRATTRKAVARRAP